MDKLETRRRNPVARIALVVVLLLIIFEVFVIFGALELKAQTVAKYAPWAHESYLKLVGEHPESAPRWAAVEEPDEEGSIEPTVAGMTGLDLSAIPVLVETNEATSATNFVIEASVPVETESEPVPVVAPTNAPKSETQEIVPVG